MAKLYKTAIKIKEILSANEEFPVFVESLINDIDFRDHLTRTEVEAAAEKLGMWQRVIAPVNEALAQANLTAVSTRCTALQRCGSGLTRCGSVPCHRLI